MGLNTHDQPRLISLGLVEYEFKHIQTAERTSAWRPRPYLKLPRKTLEGWRARRSNASRANCEHVDETISGSGRSHVQPLHPAVFRQQHAGGLVPRPRLGHPGSDKGRPEGMLCPAEHGVKEHV